MAIERAMARFSSSLRRLAGVCYTATFSVAISLVSLILIDGIIGIPVILLRKIQFNLGFLVDLCSSVLRAWFSLFMGHLEHFSRLSIVLTGDAFYPGEHALVVCNHRSWLDTIIMYSLARQVQMHGDVKFLAKRSLLLFPIFGFAGVALDVVIFIKRQSDSAGRRMGKVFSSLLDSRRGGRAYWLINYLEGTRFTKQKQRDAQNFAHERHLKTLHYVLQPRTKGFVSTVHALRHNAKAVYDITIGYEIDENEEMRPTFPEIFFTPPRKDRVVHVHQRRIPLEHLPTDGEELKKWIYTLYEQKDELLCGFRQNGHFAGRPMRWNRMTWAYWIQSQILVYGGFIISGIVLYKVFRFLR